jgi:hypothetical protein
VYNIFFFFWFSFEVFGIRGLGVKPLLEQQFFSNSKTLLWGL